MIEGLVLGVDEVDPDRVFVNPLNQTRGIANGKVISFGAKWRSNSQLSGPDDLAKRTRGATSTVRIADRPLTAVVLAWKARLYGLDVRSGARSSAGRAHDF